MPLSEGVPIPEHLRLGAAGVSGNPEGDAAGACDFGGTVFHILAAGDACDFSFVAALSSTDFLFVPGCARSCSASRALFSWMRDEDPR